ncbi:MAG: alpha/beta hydrolase [Candidatus Paceibacterota bacterium]|jgi:hypothetical protein|nr:alpha/beta hydrolase [Candidatus Paceibacterota bacterium]
MEKQQILVIHGGNAFTTNEQYINSLQNSRLDLDKLRMKKDWKDSLQEKLGGAFDVLQPRMPNASNAQYEEWKLWFEKAAVLLDDDIILVGHSLGGIFLAKYLSENDFPKKIKATFLISAPFSNGEDEPLGSFVLSKPLKKMEKQGGKIFLYHSKDDKVVPFTEVKKYIDQLAGATTHFFEDRGHFNLESFPELIQEIQNISSY